MARRRASEFKAVILAYFLAFLVDLQELMGVSQIIFKSQQQQLSTSDWNREMICVIRS